MKNEERVKRKMLLFQEMSHYSHLEIFLIKSEVVGGGEPNIKLDKTIPLEYACFFPGGGFRRRFTIRVALETTDVQESVGVMSAHFGYLLFVNLDIEALTTLYLQMKAWCQKEH